MGQGQLEMYPTFANMVDVCHWQAELHPKKIGYTFLRDGETDEHNMTYGELDREARLVAAKLQAAAEPGDRILLVFEPGLEYVKAFFGCLYAGMVAVPAYPPDLLRMDRMFSRLTTILQDSQSKVVLGSQSTMGLTVSQFGTTRQKPTVLVMDDSPNWERFPYTPVDLNLDDLALLQYTSGSTMLPRGVQITHGNLLYQVREMRRYDGDHVLGVSWLPLYHDLGLIGGVVLPLYCSRRIVMMSPLMFIQRPLRWLHAISRYRASTTGAPNFGYDYCVRKFRKEDADGLDLSCWRIAMSGAEPVRPDTLERFAEVFEPYGFQYSSWRPCYGLAEATLGVSGVLTREKPSVVAFDAEALKNKRAIPAHANQSQTRRIVSLGQPIPETELLIVDPESRCAVPDGGVGEVWMRSPSVAKGYWGRPDDTRHTFQAYLTDTGKGPYLRTGDIGFRFQGELFLTGRLKDLIILNGKNFYPNDLEYTASGCHPSLVPHGAAAFSVDEEDEERLVIVQEIHRPRKVDLEAVAEDVRQSIAREQQAWLSALVFIKPGSLPKTSSGKVQRYETKRRFEAGEIAAISEWRWNMDDNATIIDASAETERTHPPTAEEIQEWIVQRLSRIYEIDPEQVNVGDSIRQYVMDSVNLIMLGVELEKWLGRIVHPVMLLDAPSITEIAERLSGDHEYSEFGLPDAASVDGLSETQLDQALLRLMSENGSAKKSATLDDQAALNPFYERVQGIYDDDHSANFLELFLDKRMIYSCAYFEHNDMTLEEAQLAKLDLALNKLELEPGQRLLDVGCGWGACAIRAAEKYGVDVVALTLSKNQAEHVHRLAKRLPSGAGKVDVRLQGWEEFDEPVDCIVSIGAFEHFRIARHLRFFQRCAEILPPGGMMLLHTIVMYHTSTLLRLGLPISQEQIEFYRFITTEIFPGGGLADPDFIADVSEKADLIVQRRHALQLHYARTLETWAGNLQKNKDKAVAIKSQKDYDRFMKYLTGCAKYFREGYLDLYQFTLKRRDV